MSRFKTRLFVGAGALLAATALGAAANAATLVQGGGSSLLAPYWAQSTGCYDTSSPNGTFVKRGVPVGTAPGTVVTPAAPIGVTCTPVALYSFGYVSSGSGAGVGAVLAHDGAISLFGLNPSGSGKVYPTGGIQLGLSDNPLGDIDVGVYTVGTNQPYTTPSGTVITTPATYQGLTFGGSGSNYPVPKPKYGAMVQFPLTIDPVAVAYNPSYKSGFQLHLAAGAVLKLDAKAYCKIFTGEISDWGDSYLASINGVSSLKDPADTGAAPIHPVGRSDSSGTTSIFTRHLAAVCGSVLSGSNPYLSGTTTLPGTISGIYTLADGSGGVATAINGAAGSIGYIGPDYVLPYVTNTGTNTFNLPAAKLKNAVGSYTAPSPAAATKAFGSVAPPTGADVSNPTKWVQSSSASEAIANPTAVGSYPIVGTTNFVGYTCYTAEGKVKGIRGIYNFIKGTKGTTILNNAGLTTIPLAWRTAIYNTFLAPTVDTAPLNLFLARATSGTDGLQDGFINSSCNVSGVVGG